MKRRRVVLPFAGGRFARVPATMAALAGLMTACTNHPVPPPVAGCVTHSVSSEPNRPNIVLVLTDDLSSNLVRFMPHVLAMERSGMTFADYTVTDSLCCPSRASILTGRFPQNTHVFTNRGPDGGFQLFHRRGEERSTFATALRAAGYRTALMGKYLNGYRPREPRSAPYVAPGWNEWDVAGGGYFEYDYYLNQDGHPIPYGRGSHDYLTDVLGRRAVRFISGCSSAGSPFFLEVATFAPHRPYVPAPQDRQAFPGLLAPRTPAYDRLPRHPPRWLVGQQPLTPDWKSRINRIYRLRAQSVLAVDRMIGSLEAALKRTGQAANTYFLFSSDNGYHMGEHRLLPGKLTAFDTDIRVPLVITGPGIAPGRTTTAVAENVDLAPTFEALAGITPAADIDGRSLLPLLRTGRAPGWRVISLVEHHGPDKATAGPDDEGPSMADPPSYQAIRGVGFTYVEYADGSREFYDLVRDPDELDNLAAELRPLTLKALHRELMVLAGCQGATACWAAAHPRPVPGLPQ